MRRLICDSRVFLLILRRHCLIPLAWQTGLKYTGIACFAVPLQRSVKLGCPISWNALNRQPLKRIMHGADAGEDMTEETDRHAIKMAKKKAARDKIMATKTDEKGLVIVHTGKGKGKSTAAFGMIFRCIAHGMPCAVVQFIKGGMATGERDLIAARFSDLCQFHTMGEGFTWETQDKTRDTEMAQAAWKKAKELIRDDRNAMVLLDEINIAIRYGYVDIGEVAAFLKAEKPQMTHVVLTGRNAEDELIEIADLVTEMELVKHPFRSGIKAQAGVEY